MASFLSCVLVTTLVTLTSQAPQTPDASEPARDLLRQSTFAFELGEDGLSGVGADRLRAEIDRAAFLCIGESHRNVETPDFLRALLPQLESAGYGALAIETGERIASVVGQQLQTSPEAAAKVLVSAPYSAPFIDGQTELKLLDDAVKRGFELWGLDQVFLGGARFNLSQLVELAPNDVAREIAQKELRRAAAGFLHFAKTGDDSKGYLRVATREDFAALEAAFADEPAGLRILEELAASQRIYGLHRAGQYYRSNVERIALMKRHLAERLRESSGVKKVALKFGSVHMGRGYSPLQQLDLGNAAAELASLRDSESFHIYLTSKAIAGRDPETAVYGELLGESDWAYIDLRPLRALFFGNGPLDLKSVAPPTLAWRYDAVVITREFTPAKRLPGIPEMSR